MSQRLKMTCMAALLLVLLPLSALAKTEADVRWESAQRDKKRLLLDKKLRKYRHNWLNVIRRFEKFQERHPKDPRAPKAFYRMAKLRIGLYRAARSTRDLFRAEENLKKIIKGYPKSSLGDDARFLLGEISRKYRRDKDQAYLEYYRVVADYPKGDMAPRAKKMLKKLGPKDRPKLAKKIVERPRAKPKAKPKPKKKAAPRVPGRSALVTGIRHWSNPAYTRVVIDLTRPVKFKKRLLKANPKIRRPPRLFIDMEPARLAEKFNGPILIQDGLLRKVRAGQFEKDVVRVVLDIDSIEGYKMFSLSDPFRIVVDVAGQEEKVAALKIPPSKKKLTLREQLGLKVRTVVIDPGHGGKDPGAIGPGKVREKDVVLGIARRLKKLMEKELNCRVIMTRNSDKFLPLEERTAIANTRGADLFVSIHVNAHRDRRVSGVQTYFLNLATDEEAVRVAALENATTKRSLSDLEKILNDLMLNSKIIESSQLAERVHTAMLKTLKKGYRGVRDRGVKQAPFYVLIGAKMPAILVETSFITNSREAKRLRSTRYQTKLARGIMEGIKRYMDWGS